MIKLTNYIWFIQEQGGKFITNIYSGSLGTNPIRGFMNKTTFNYKAYIKVSKETGPVSFQTEWYLRYPWSTGGKVSETFIKEFSPSQEGINEAENWLIEQFNNSCEKDMEGKDNDDSSSV
ncbi:MAG: hypothetical protein J6V50_00235 [Clostridia bacterium]|nr:hypothetical protein [Clostridia bacterium]